MPTATMPSRSERLNVRATAQQARLIRMAAKESSANVSQFVLESACIRSEETLASKRHFEFNPVQWRAFLRALDRPAKAKPRLRRLLSQPGILDAK
jgi:uncharacterized protein (DUF1778 family)